MENNSTANDIKKIIEQQKLEKAAGANSVVQDRQKKSAEPVTEIKPGIGNTVDQSMEPVTSEKHARQGVNKNIQQKKEGGEPDIIKRIKDYEKGNEPYMLHIRVNERTYHLANQITAATKIPVSKLMGFAMLELMEKNPELEEAIKKHLKSLEL